MTMPFGCGKFYTLTLTLTDSCDLHWQVYAQKNR